MKRPIQVLIVEDSSNDARLLVAELQRGDYAPKWEQVQTAEAMQAALARQAWDIVLADYSMPRFDAPAALETLRQSGKDIPFIVVSGSIGENIAVEMMKKGASDYLLKDDLRRFIPAVERELRESQNRSQRREAELQVQKAFRAIEQTADHILITNREGIIEYVNPALLKRTGYTADEVIGQNPRLFKSGKQDESFYANLWQTILSGQSFHGRFINRCKNGDLFHEEKTITPLKDAQGHVTHFVSTGMDFTVRKQAEDKIREQAAWLDLAQDAIFVMDMTGRVRYWNKGAERQSGWTAAEAVNQKMRDLLFRSMPTPALMKGEQTVRERGEWIGELEEYTKNGKGFIVQSRFTLIRDEEGHPKGILVIDTDITEKKRLEAQVLRSQRMESIGTLAGGIAHDLNNVLAPLLISVQMLKEKITDDEGRTILDMLESTVHRGADLVQQVLAFGRGVQGRRIHVQPARIAREIAHVIQETFPKSIEFKSHLAPDAWQIIGDPTQIHQVMLNLCINARDAMPTGGKLSVRIENAVLDDTSARITVDGRPGTYVCLQVDDTGNGIPVEIQDKIFDPFFTTKEPGKGTGLGLSTSLGIIKSHGGFINCYSEPGRGSTFKVYLPAEANSEAGQIETDGGMAHSPRGHNELVLVVDDETSILNVVQKTLERNGYRVLTAANGAEAVALYTQRQHAINAVITDMAMPVMDGPATIIALRAINPTVPIIASSGFSSQSNLGTNGNNCRFIPKPYTAETMLRALQELLDSHSSA